MWPLWKTLHLTPPIADALARLGWSADDARLREAAPTAARGHNLVLVVPSVPGGGRAGAGRACSPGSERAHGGLLLAPASQLDEWGRVARQARRARPRCGSRCPWHRTRDATPAGRCRRPADHDTRDRSRAPAARRAARGRARGRAPGLAGSVGGRRGGWSADAGPEGGAADRRDSARRASDRPGRALRPARADPGRRRADAEPVGPVRTVTVPWSRRVAALADLVELLDPTSLVIWTLDRGLHDAITAGVWPRRTRRERRDRRRAGAQAPSSPSICPTRRGSRSSWARASSCFWCRPAPRDTSSGSPHPRRPLRLPGALDAATTAAAARRAAIVRAIETGTPDRALLTLAPLFERHDPAAVAAALYELWTSAAGPAGPHALRTSRPRPGSTSVWGRRTERRSTTWSPC